MNGTPGEMGNLLAQAQRMQRALDEVRAGLRALEVEGTAANGQVRATVTGEGNLLRVRIGEDLYRARDVAAVERAVTEAVTEAQARAHQQATERLSAVTGGLQLPGFL